MQQQQQLTETNDVIKREFQTRHQLLVWRQYTTLEHRWYRIVEMDVENNALYVKRLFETDECRFNNKVLNLVKTSAMPEEKEEEKEEEEKK